MPREIAPKGSLYQYCGTRVEDVVVGGWGGNTRFCTRAIDYGELMGPYPILIYRPHIWEQMEHHA